MRFLLFVSCKKCKRQTGAAQRVAERGSFVDNGTNSYRRFREERDENGLVEIIRDYKDGLILYLNSFVGNLHTSEMLAEDTFVLLGTKKPKDKGKGSFKTWLYTIGRNLAIDYLRRSSKQPLSSIDDHPGLTDDEESLESSYIREEQKILLYRAMHRLKAEYRQILWLVYFEGFSVKEAAGIMKKSVHSTETLVYRARRALKTQLEKEGFTYEKL